MFKGGTCLSKVHSDFYRMSEDLDFAFSVPLDASRPQRSKMIVPMKEHLAKLAQTARLLQRRRATSGIQQFDAVHREPELPIRGDRPGRVDQGRVQHPGTDPGTRGTPACTHPAWSILSAKRRRSRRWKFRCCRAARPTAEKLRAALTRREPAIRDFYDIDHGVRSGRLTHG